MADGPIPLTRRVAGSTLLAVAFSVFLLARTNPETTMLGSVAVALVMGLLVFGTYVLDVRNPDPDYPDWVHERAPLVVVVVLAALVVLGMQRYPWVAEYYPAAFFGIATSTLLVLCVEYVRN